MRGIKNILIFVVAASGWGAAWAGPYAETGIAADDPSVLGWATGVANLQRGPVDISDPDGPVAKYGLDEDALGPASASYESPYSVISLGDGGQITLTFDLPIANGAGADFAVFENAFESAGGNFFLELAFVEVSSDGAYFVRFPAISLTQTDTQVGSFTPIDPTDISNLAGKHTSGFGTPFDLSDLRDFDPQRLDLNNIRYVRIIDVIGSIDEAYATRDSNGNIINDPWKTNFLTGGFDLDGVAVLNTVPEPAVGALLLVSGLVLVARLRRRR